MNSQSTALFSIPEREPTNSELRRKWLMDRNVDLLMVNKGGAKWHRVGPDLNVTRLSRRTMGNGNAQGREGKLRRFPAGHVPSRGVRE